MEDGDVLGLEEIILSMIRDSLKNLVKSPGPENESKGRELEDASLKELAKTFLERQERPDPEEYKKPSHPDQTLRNSSTRFEVTTYLHDPYQSTLVDSGWLNTLIEELNTYPELYDKSVRLVIRPRFNKATLDSGSGYPIGSRSDERNSHKNRFLLEAFWVLPTDSPMRVSYHYEVWYHPHNKSFQLLRCESQHEWCSDQEVASLETTLLGLGILREVTVDNVEPDASLTNMTMMGVDRVPTLVPVRQQKHVISVAIDSLLSFPSDLKSTWGWTDTRILEPVIVRNKESLEAFRDSLYQGLLVRRTDRLDGFRASSTLRKVDDVELRVLMEELKSKDYFSFDYHDSWSGRVKVWVGPEIAIVDSRLRFDNSEYPGDGAVFAGKTPSEAWQNLEAEANSDEVWTPRPERCGFDGVYWFLEKVGSAAREARGWLPDACPFVDFCFQIMRSAGLELDVKQFVSWHHHDEPW